MLQKIIVSILFAAFFASVTAVISLANALAQTSEFERTSQNNEEGNEVSYSADGGKTWKEAGLLEALGDTEVITGADVHIELRKDITLVSTGENPNWTNSEQLIGTAENSNWVIDGKGYTIKRGAGTEKIFLTGAATSTITFKDITIDGGAVWSGTDVAARTNTVLRYYGTAAHLIEIDDGSTVILESGTILQNSDLDVYHPGGAISVKKGTLTIKDGVEIRNNAASNGGAIITESDSVVNIEGGRIYGNKAAYGGAIYNNATLNIMGGEIYNNYTFYYGGGVDNVASGTVNMTDGRIYNNSANQMGGGVFSQNVFNMTGGKIDNNTAMYGGGGGVGGYAKFTMSGGEICNNTAPSGSGGGVYIYDEAGITTVFDMKGGNIRSNEAYMGGGILCDNSAAIKMTAGSVDYNKASDQGGGIFLNADTTKFTMEGGTINNNKAASGAGIYNNGTFDMKGGQINGNEILADSYGGGVYNSNKFTMSGGSICNNIAPSGAGIMTYSGSSASVTITGGLVKGNICSNNGGGIFFYNGELNISGNPVIIENTNSDNKADNIYLLGTNIINVIAPITDGAKIGVNKVVPGSDAVAVTSACLADYTKRIYSDSELYYTMLKDGASDNVVYLDFNEEVAPSITLPSSMTVHIASDADAVSDEVCEMIKEECLKALQVSVDSRLQNNVHYIIEESYDVRNKIYTARFCLTDEGRNGWYIAQNSAVEANCQVIVHKWSADWQENEIGHWHICSETDCDKASDVEEHNHNGMLEKDSTHHWYECIVCGAKLEVAEHTGNWKITEAATHDKEGLMQRECTECGYKQQETVDKLPYTDEEKVADAKKVVEDALADITVTNDTKQEDIQGIIDEALTEAGIPDVTVTVSKFTKTEATKEGEGRITGNIEIVSKNDDTVKDSVSVDKTIEKLPKTEAEKVADAKRVVEDALADITVTNDTKQEDIQSIIDEALTEAGIPDVTVTVGEFTKTEATKEGEGRITGNIEIVSRNDDTVKDSVSVDKTIEKLPKTEAEKVADAKKVVEEALAGITVTNDTKQEDIQSIIDEALTKASIPDVTVTVSEFTKTEATKEGEGRITGNIEIVSKNDEKIKDNLIIDKTIEKLPKTEADKVADAKKVIEEALADITVTNDTKKEDIQKEIDDALNKADITGVTATVDDITKTEATEENEGSISVSVEIVSKNDEKVKDDLIINKAIEKLPAGKIETDKEQGVNTPETEFGDSKDSIIDAVLTPEDKNLVEGGKDIKIILTVDNIDASVAEADKQEINEKILENTETETYEVGEYLDINLYKLIGADRTKISHTSGKIKIVLEVPDSLKNTDSNKTRGYAVVRVHEGVAEILPDMDSDAATITIETDLFSTYAIVYKDSAIGGSGDNTEGNDSTGSGDNTEDNDSTGSGGNTGDNDNTGDSGNKADTPNTGDTAPIGIYAILAMAAGLTHLYLLFGNRKRNADRSVR